MRALTLYEYVIPAFQNRPLVLKAFRDQDSWPFFLLLLFYLFWTPLTFGPYARSFGPTGLGKKYEVGAGPDIYLPDLCLYSTYFSRVKNRFATLKFWHAPAEDQPTKVVLETSRGPPGDPLAIFWRSQAPSRRRVSRFRVF